MKLKQNPYICPVKFKGHCPSRTTYKPLKCPSRYFKGFFFAMHANMRANKNNPHNPIPSLLFTYFFTNQITKLFNSMKKLTRLLKSLSIYPPGFVTNSVTTTYSPTTISLNNNQLL